MLRITGGDLKGKKILVPKGDAVRPTGAKVREAFFSMVQNDLPEMVFVDLFAGSGLMGLEALSRGASRCVFVEVSSAHAKLIRENLAELRSSFPHLTRLFQEHQVFSVDVLRFDLARLLRETPSCLVWCDPPYVRAKNYLEHFANLFGGTAGPIFAIETRADLAPQIATAFQVPPWKQRRYGDTLITIFKSFQ